MVAWTAACRHLARDTSGLRPYRPANCTALAATVGAVTMWPLTAWRACLLPEVHCQDAQPREPSSTYSPTAPLMAQQLYVVAVALLADGGESFVQHHGPAQIAGSIQRLQCDVPHPWPAMLPERTRIRDADGGTPPPGPGRGRGW